MKKTALLLLALIIISCQSKKEDGSKTFVVAPDMLHCFPNSTGEFMEGGCDFYGTHNFIIGDSSEIYYYSGEHFVPGCGTGKQYVKAPFIDLQPHQLLVIRESQIEDFVNLNVVQSRDELNYIIIASRKDTFKSTAIPKIYDRLGKGKGRPLAIIRRTTQEENEVLEHRINNKRYSPFDVKWDTTKIILPDYMKN